MKIPFNKPFLSGKELEYIREAVESGKISGDGEFTRKCQRFFESSYGFHKTLLTTSCTDALEMCAILIDTKPGDEIIMPSFTFVSTANAFVLRGAKIVFADSRADNPNIDDTRIEMLITPKTKAIVVVHYAGIACNMDPILSMAKRHGLFVIEDAAQSVDSFYKGRPLGSLGELSAFSFHETKNVIAGEGGMIAINDKRFEKRAEIIREKGTNRSAFFRGEVDKYGWVDVGSSFLPSEVTAAFLFAQLESLRTIQDKRIKLWNLYLHLLSPLEKEGHFQVPQIPKYATNNAHMFYLICSSIVERTKLIAALREKEILSVFHYQSLHRSPYYRAKYAGPILSNADRYTDCLLRLPMYYELREEDVTNICSVISKFYVQ